MLCAATCKVLLAVLVAEAAVQKPYTCRPKVGQKRLLLLPSCRCLFPVGVAAAVAPVAGRAASASLGQQAAAAHPCLQTAQAPQLVTHWDCPPGCPCCRAWTVGQAAAAAAIEVWTQNPVAAAARCAPSPQGTAPRRPLRHTASLAAAQATVCLLQGPLGPGPHHHPCSATAAAAAVRLWEWPLQGQLPRLPCSCAAPAVQAAAVALLAACLVLLQWGRAPPLELSVRGQSKGAPGSRQGALSRLPPPRLGPPDWPMQQQQAGEQGQQQQTGAAAGAPSAGRDPAAGVPSRLALAPPPHALEHVQQQSSACRCCGATVAAAV